MAPDSAVERPRQRGALNESSAGVSLANIPVPAEQFDGIEDHHEQEEQNVQYPAGPKLWLSMTSLCIACFLSGLDLTIVAVTVPSLTDQFKTMADIGWYSAAYGMTMSAFVFFFGEIYTIFPVKAIFICGLVIFEAGSLLCTLAPSSPLFIFGRAISGLGRGAINGGVFKLLRHSFPLSKQALMSSLVGACQSAGLVSAPVIGGALIDALSWRACFGINLPLGIFCIALTAYGFHDPIQNPVASLPLHKKLKRINLLGTLLAVPAITCLLMALQWGGSKYGWNDWRIILLLVFCGVLFLGLGYLQHRQGIGALLPPHIFKQRSILAGMWYSACCEGILAVTEYYMSIYFQGVRGYTAARSGLFALPMVGGMALALVAAGVGTTLLGHYYPFMLATSVLAPIASGLLTTLDLDEQVGKAVALLAMLGAAIGLGIQGPYVAMQAVLPAHDVSLGGAMLNFGSGMGSALWVCASATLFQDRLVDEIQESAPGANVTELGADGLSGLRQNIGPERLQSVLAGYDKAVLQTLYIPLGLGILTLLGSVAMERRSIKKKQT